MGKVKNTVIYLSSCMLLMLFKVNSVYAVSTAECNGVFGDPRVPSSVAYLIKEVLNVFRILAPILVIVLGTLDLFKAVIASKEDEMRKAQSALMKRVILGVCLFFVPSIIYFVIDIASQAGLGLDACMLKF